LKRLFFRWHNIFIFMRSNNWHLILCSFLSAQEPYGFNQRVSYVRPLKLKMLEARGRIIRAVTWSYGIRAALEARGRSVQHPCGQAIPEARNRRTDHTWILLYLWRVLYWYLHPAWTMKFELRAKREIHFNRVCSPSRPRWIGYNPRISLEMNGATSVSHCANLRSAFHLIPCNKTRRIKSYNSKIVIFEDKLLCCIKVLHMPSWKCKAAPFRIKKNKKSPDLEVAILFI
jgi:hypothetical protein